MPFSYILFTATLDFAMPDHICDENKFTETCKHEVTNLW